MNTTRRAAVAWGTLVLLGGPTAFAQNPRDRHPAGPEYVNSNTAPGLPIRLVLLPVAASVVVPKLSVLRKMRRPSGLTEIPR